MRYSVTVNFSGKYCDFTKFLVETWIKRVLNKQSYFGAFCKKSQKCRKIAKKSPHFFMFFQKTDTKGFKILKFENLRFELKIFIAPKNILKSKVTKKSRQSRQNGDLCAPTPPCFSNQAKTASWRHRFYKFEAFLLKFFLSIFEFLPIFE